MSTLREKFFAIPVSERKAVDVPEIGEAVYATTITAAKQVDISEAAKLYPDAPGSVLLVVFGIVDADGNPVFSPADIPALSDRSAALVTRLAAAVGEQDKIGELAKNS